MPVGIAYIGSTFSLNIDQTDSGDIQNDPDARVEIEFGCPTLNVLR